MVSLGGRKEEGVSSVDASPALAALRPTRLSELTWLDLVSLAHVFGRAVVEEVSID